MVSLTCGGRPTLISPTFSNTSSLSFMGWRWGASLRLKVKICRTRSRARRPALSISFRLIWAKDSEPASCLAKLTLPKIAPKMLLKSWAIPPAMVPIACIFCDSRSWCSMALRAVRSRANTVVMLPSECRSYDTFTSRSSGIPCAVKPKTSPKEWEVLKFKWPMEFTTCGKNPASGIPSACSGLH